MPETVVDQIVQDRQQAAVAAQQAPVFDAPIFDEGPKEIPQEVIDQLDAGRKSGPAPSAPPPPQFVSMDPLEGVRETYIPTNILGQSFDPGVRENYAQRMMQAVANIQQGGYPMFKTPTSAIPQTQFGGYGAPVPMAPLAPFAGLGGPPPPPQIASGAIVNPGTGKPMPVGIAPPMPRNPIT